MFSLKSKAVKKSIILMAALAICVLALAGCGNQAKPDTEVQPPAATTGDEAPLTIDPKETAEANTFMEAFENTVEKGDFDKMFEAYPKEMFETLSGLDSGDQKQMKILKKIFAEIDIEDAVVYPHGGYSFVVEGIVQSPVLLGNYTADEVLKDIDGILKKEDENKAISSFALKLDKVDGNWEFSGDEGFIQNASCELGAVLAQ